MKPRSRAVFEKLVYEAFAASLQSEEGRPIQLQLLFGHRPMQLTVAFDKPLPYTASNLVKLAPTIGIGFRWLVIVHEQQEQDTLNIIGICDPELSPAALTPMRVLGGGLSAHQPNPLGMKLSVFSPGWIRIETGLSFFELRNSCIRFPFSVSSIKYVREWYEEAASHLDFSQLPVDEVVGEVVLWAEGRKQNAGGLVRRTWGSILNKVSGARHGGTFLVVPEGVEVSSLVRFKYPLRSDQLQTAIWKRGSFEPGLSNPHYRRSMAGTDLDDAHFSERDLARTADLVASFSAVDGATVLHRDLTLLGFGAEILDTRLPDNNELVQYGKHPHGKPEDKPLNNFGMRHRSAYRFSERVEGAIAFVVSQDGNTRVFCNVDGKVIAFEGPTPEDWAYSKFRVDNTPDQKSFKGTTT